MKTFLITGGAGFVGSSLADRLLQNPDYQVVIADNLVTGFVENLPKNPRLRFVKCDANNYRDISAVMLATPFDCVFHYAALVGVKRTLENPKMVLDDIEGIKHILHLSKSTGVKRVFFSSSSEVYGEPVVLPQHEHTTPLNSRLPYAVVKNVCEAFLRAYHQEHGLEYTIFRFFNTYGEKQSADFVMTKFLKAAVRNEDITVYGDGSQTRTFCYIQDNLDVTMACLEQNQYVNDILNIGNDRVTSMLELAQIIIKLSGSKSNIVHLPPLPEGDMTRRQPDIAKMKILLKKPLTTLEEGIQKLLSAKKW